MLSIPDIYPDESFYSFYCRYHLTSGSRNVKTTNQILWGGKHKCYCSLLFPTSLHDVVIAMDSVLFNDESIINHTALPFYKNFMTRETYERCLKHALFGGNGIYSKLRALVGDDFSPDVIKYCPECQKERPLTINVSLSPAFVKVCPKHKCMLLERKTKVEHLTGNLLVLTEKDYDSTVIPCHDEKWIMLAEMAHYFYHLNEMNIDLLRNVLNDSLEKHNCTSYINSLSSMNKIMAPVEYIELILMLYGSSKEFDSVVSEYNR
jgi:hypothetical protein